MIGVGTLATGITAEVDADGTVHRDTVRFGWRVRSGDDWLVPGHKGAAPTPTRQSRPRPAPIVHTALRIPGGDAIHRVYAVGEGDGALVVVEVENDSPQAIAVGFVLGAPGAVTVDDDAARIDGAQVAALPRRPGAVEDGNVIVFPVPHRTTVRVALTTRPGVDVRALPDADAASRAWDALLDRGMRTELPEPLQSEVDSARADLLLAPPSADAFVALEAWGFDDEAMAMWERLPRRGRRIARQAHGGGVLGETHAALVHEIGPTLEVLPGFRPAWLGQALAVHDVPMRFGVCSFALRWHGARPALLWEVPPGVTVRVPPLDPAWSSIEPAGEALLAEPPTGLLPMGEITAAAGTDVAPPEQFT